MAFTEVLSTPTCYQSDGQWFGKGVQFHRSHLLSNPVVVVVGGVFSAEKVRCDCESIFLSFRRLSILGCILHPRDLHHQCWLRFHLRSAETATRQAPAVAPDVREICLNWYRTLRTLLRYGLGNFVQRPRSGNVRRFAVGSTEATGERIRLRPCSMRMVRKT